MPKSFFQLQKLQTIVLRDNKLKEIGFEFQNFKSINTLELSKNKISNIDSTFWKNENLQFLYLSGNQLENLPNEKVALPKLEILELQQKLN